MAVDANIKNLQTVGDIYIATALIDPTGGAGIDAPQGSLVVFGSALYIKNSALGGLATDWSQIATGGSAWQLGGNTLGADTNFGSSDNFDVVMIRSGSEYMRLDDSSILVSQNITFSDALRTMGDATNKLADLHTQSVDSLEAVNAAAASDIIYGVDASQSHDFQVASVNVLEISGTGITASQPLAMSAQKITGLANGTDPQDAVTKAQLDSVAAGLDPKESVRFASAGGDVGGTYSTTNGGQLANIDADAVLDIPVALDIAINDRVLVKDQADAKQNGIYIVTAVVSQNDVSLERADDQDGSPAAEVSGGNFTYVENGDSEGGRGYVVVGDGVLTLNTDNIVWTQFSADVTDAANRTLSNLNATSINQNLVADGNGTRSLGSAINQWNQVYARDYRIYGAAGGIQGRLRDNGTELDLNSDSKDLVLSIGLNQILKASSSNTLGAQGVDIDETLFVGTGGLGQALASDGVDANFAGIGVTNTTNFTNQERTDANGVNVNLFAGQVVATDDSATVRVGGDAVVEGGSGENSTAGLVQSGGVIIRSNDAVALGTNSGSNVDSGSITIQTGLPANAGTRGTITLNAAQDGSLLTNAPSGSVDLAIATVGYVKSSSWQVGGNAFAGDNSTYVIGTTTQDDLEIHYNNGVRQAFLGSATQILSTTAIDFQVTDGTSSLITNVDSAGNNITMKMSDGRPADELRILGSLLSDQSASQAEGSLVLEGSSVGLTADGDYSAGKVFIQSGGLGAVAGATNYSVNSGDIELKTADGARVGGAVGDGSSGNIILRTGNSSLDRGELQVFANRIEFSNNGLETLTIAQDNTSDVHSISAGTGYDLDIASGFNGSGNAGDLNLYAQDGINDAARGIVSVRGREVQLEIGGSELSGSQILDQRLSAQSSILGDSTFQDLATVTLADNKVYIVEAFVVGAESNTESVAYKRTLHIEKNAGAASIIIESADFTSENVTSANKGNYDVRFQITTNNLDVDVKSQTGTTLEWRAMFRVISASDI